MQISAQAANDLGDFGSNLMDDNEYGPSLNRHIHSWLTRVIRGQTSPENLHEAPKWIFDAVKAKRYDWESDIDSGEDNTADVDYEAVLVDHRAVAEELQALEFSSDAEIAEFIIHHITG